MVKFKRRGVQEIAWQGENCRSRCPRARGKFARGAIKRVADYRMPNGGEMDADLVSAAGINLHVQQREFPVLRTNALADSVMGNSFATAFAARGHAGPANAIAANAGGNRPSILLHGSVNQGNVGFVYLATAELRSELAVRDFILGHNNEATGFFVEAMNDSRAQFA